MKSRLVSYKAQCFFALIPFVGLLIDWIISWLNIYKTTKSRKYVFIHYITWIIPIIITVGIFAFCYFFLILKITNRTMFIFSCLASSYLTCIIIAYFSISIAKKIIATYNEKIIAE